MLEVESSERAVCVLIPLGISQDTKMILKAGPHHAIWLLGTQCVEHTGPEHIAWPASASGALKLKGCIAMLD